MTNSTPDPYDTFNAHILALIDAELANYDDDAQTELSPLYRLTITIMRAATIAQLDALRYAPDSPTRANETSYYFSDSTYDELTNPAYTIDLCATAISCFYELPDDLPSAMRAIADDASEYLFTTLDESPNFIDLMPDLDSISNLIADEYHFPRMNLNAFPFTRD